MRRNIDERHLLFASSLTLLLIARGAGAQTAVGYGAVTSGGATDLPGRPHDTCVVTSLSDSGAGSLRDCVQNRQGPRIVTFAVAGKIKLATEIKVRWPYITIDGSSAPAPGITIEQATPQTPALKFVATHDFIVTHIRSAGLWEPGLGPPINDAATISVDGDGGQTHASWDPSPTTICNSNGRGACRFIIDRVTLSGAMDDGPDFWCGVHDGTISRTLIIDSYHPRGTGCDAVVPRSDPRARYNLTEYANVYADNGERQPKLNEGVYDYDFVNNIVFGWQDYGTAIGKGAGGYGMLIDDDGAQDRLNVVGNVFLPDATGNQAAICAANPDASECREEWDCVFGDLPKADGEADLLADGLHFAGNLFGPRHNPNECKSTATGQQWFSRPYTLQSYSTASIGDMERVLDGAGVPWRTPRESAVVEDVRDALRARLGAGPAPSPAPSPSPSPSASPTPSPSASPTPGPTPSPSPSAAPTPAPSPSPTPWRGWRKKLRRRFCWIVGC